VDDAISLGQSICIGKLGQLLKTKIQEALIVARPSAIWREAFIARTAWMTPHNRITRP
jgi:hypothetical protein